MKNVYESIPAMLLSKRKHTDIPIRGIIHIGAGNCEEWNDYKKLGAEKVLWIEGNPKFVDEGRKLLSVNTPNQMIVQSFLSHKNGTETFYITEEDSRNDSLMKPRDWYKVVAIKDTIVVNVRRLDKLFSDLGFLNIGDYNTLVVDVQGAELKVLVGAGDILNHMDFIVSEAWYDELEVFGNDIYTGGTQISKLKSFIENIYEFEETVRTPTDEENPNRTHSWLDVLFERR